MPKQLTKYDPLNEWLEVVGEATIGEGLSYTYELESVIDDIVAAAVNAERERCKHIAKRIRKGD